MALFIGPRNQEVIYVGHLLEILLLTRMMFDLVFLHTPFRNTLIYKMMMMLTLIILMRMLPTLVMTQHLQDTTVVLPFCLPLLPAAFLPEPLAWLLFLNTCTSQLVIPLPCEHLVTYYIYLVKNLIKRV